MSQPPPAPERRAIELRLAGLSWTKVAGQTGFADARDCQLATAEYLRTAGTEAAAAPTDPRTQRREAHLGELNSLKAAHWDAATRSEPARLDPHTGAYIPARRPDPRAATVVASIMAQIAKLERLHESDPVPRRTLLFTYSDEQGAADLQAIYDRDDATMRKAMKAASSVAPDAAPSPP